MSNRMTSVGSALRTVARRLSRLRWRRKPGGCTPEAAPFTPDSARNGDSGSRDESADLEIAIAVLDVADLLSSPELRHRLIRAVSLLPGVDIIAPGKGVIFDPDRHQWVRSEAAPSAELVMAIVETESAGVADRKGLVRRPARVVVYDIPKE